MTGGWAARYAAGRNGERELNFAQAQKDAIIIKVDNLKIPVISIDNLIKMKKKAGRDIDDCDIKQLRMIKKLRKNDHTLGNG